MQQNLQPVDPDWEMQLKSYFLPLPNHNIFTFILFSAIILILAVPLVIINASLLPQGSETMVVVIAISVSFFPFCFYCIRLTRYYLRPRLTDQEYDNWVDNFKNQLLAEGFRRTHILSSNILGEPLYIKEIVWPDSQEVKHDYEALNASLRIKWDGQGFPHASVNRFIFLYPTRDTLAVFTYEVNAFLRQGYNIKQKYYLYSQIEGLDIADVKAPGYSSELIRLFKIKLKSSDSIIIRILLSDIKTKDDVERFENMLKVFLRENQ